MIRVRRSLLRTAVPLSLHQCAKTKHDSKLPYQVPFFSMCFVLRSQSIAIFPSIPRLPRDASLRARPPGAAGDRFGGANVPAKLRLAWRALWRFCEGPLFPYSRILTASPYVPGR
jgi:hypothetical protein